LPGHQQIGFKFFREITRQIGHLNNSSNESYVALLLQHITKEVHLHYLDTSQVSKFSMHRYRYVTSALTGIELENIHNLASKADNSNVTDPKNQKDS
jgi:hypothetical protein